MCLPACGPQALVAAFLREAIWILRDLQILNDFPAKVQPPNQETMESLNLIEETDLEAWLTMLTAKTRE